MFKLVLFYLFISNAFSSGVDDWKEIKPGGETSCSRGTPFSFFIHPGDSRKIIIDFVGGGACWDEKTCKKGSITFTDSIAAFRKDAEKNLNGLYDKENPKNPLKDWLHIVVPPCTGDIFVGEKDFTYGTGRKKFKIRHRGAQNVKAVLKYVEENFQNPEKVLVSGCSGGSYGSIYWTPHVRSIYPGAKVYQLGDSGAGVITPTFFQTHAINNWDIWKNIPNWIPGLDPSKHKDIISLYKEVGDYYPDLRFSQFNYNEDEIQGMFYKMMGGKQGLWNLNLGLNLTRINLRTQNFNHFVAEGLDHCILPYKEFYTTESWGIYFKDWLRDLVSDRPLKSYVCPHCF
jgi:Pectinacetylesterase